MNHTYQTGLHAIKNIVSRDVFTGLFWVVHVQAMNRTFIIAKKHEMP